MNFRIKLKLLSPMIIGGKKLNNEYVKSLQYIPGSVLRAALAREITLKCPYYNHEDTKKKYWVDFKNEEHCKTCNAKSLCKAFNEINISHCYPMGASQYPLTAMKCKEKSEHEAFDTLIEKIKRKISFSDMNYKAEVNPYFCPSCKGRAEKHSGFYVDGQNENKNIEVIYTMITKNSINPYLRVAHDGILYSLDAIAPIVKVNGKEQELYMEGTIEGDIEEVELKKISSLYIGAYATAGFGEIQIQVEKLKQVNEKEEMKKRIEKFNKAISHGDNYYIPITLCSDAYLGLEEQINSAEYMTTEEYMKIYEKILKQWVPTNMELFTVLATNEERRGFDTSQERVKTRNLRLVTKAGSVFVFKVNKAKIDFENLYKLEKQGIGDNINHGFGCVSIVDNFHLKK